LNKVRSAGGFQTVGDAVAVRGHDLGRGELGGKSMSQASGSDDDDDDPYASHVMMIQLLLVCILLVCIFWT